MHFLPALTAAAFLLPATAVAPAIAQPIYRCGNTYSQEACKGGKVVEDKTTTLHSGHSGSTVYLCKGHGGGLFWKPFVRPTQRFSGTHGNRALRPALGSERAQAEAQWRKTQQYRSPAVVYQNRPAQPAEPGKNKSVMHWKSV
jgi:hypothetical protein